CSISTATWLALTFSVHLPSARVKASRVSVSEVFTSEKRRPSAWATALIAPSRNSRKYERRRMESVSLRQERGGAGVVKGERQAAATQAPAAGRQCHQAFGAGQVGDAGLARPENFRTGLQLQQVAAGEVHPEQAAARFQQQVAEGVEHLVAAVIRQPEPAVTAQPHEARRATTVGDVDAAGFRVQMLAGDEQRIAAFDQLQPARIGAV